jgi:hypothetical protein
MSGSDDEETGGSFAKALKPNKTPTAANNELSSQQYYDTETGGGTAGGGDDNKIVAVETDQDCKKKSTPTNNATGQSRSGVPRRTAPTRINWSACCNTKKKQWTWCAILTVLLIVGIALLAASLKKLNSTEVRHT